MRDILFVTCLLLSNSVHAQSENTWTVNYDGYESWQSYATEEKARAAVKNRFSGGFEGRLVAARHDAKFVSSKRVDIALRQTKSGRWFAHSTYGSCSEVGGKNSAKIWHR